MKNTESEIKDMSEQEKNIFLEKRAIEYLEEEVNRREKQLQEEY